MMSWKVCCVTLALATFATSLPASTKDEFWTKTAFGASVEEMRSMCAEDDPIACLKLKVVSFFDWMLQKESFQLSDDVEVTRNVNYNLNNEVASRGESGIEDNVEKYIKTHDVSFKLPVIGSTVTLGTRNLDNDELDFKVNFGEEVQARKSKLKKIIVPILVFVLLKAMTLVPLALGILGLKAWNALQLSFFSFIIAVGLAVFQLCKKIAADNAHPQISAHPPWEPAYNNLHASRSMDVGVNSDAQKLAYAAYA